MLNRVATLNPSGTNSWGSQFQARSGLLAANYSVAQTQTTQFQGEMAASIRPSATFQAYARQAHTSTGIAAKYAAQMQHTAFPVAQEEVIYDGDIWDDWGPTLGFGTIPSLAIPILVDSDIYIDGSGERPQGLYRESSDGSGQEELLYAGGQTKWPESWSPDGKTLLCTSTSLKQRYDIWALPLPGGKPVPWLQTDFNEQHAQFSPDGKWVSYQSNESGRDVGLCGSGFGAERKTADFDGWHGDSALEKRREGSLLRGAGAKGHGGGGEFQGGRRSSEPRILCLKL